MGLFGHNFKKIIHEFRIKSEDYSNDLSNEIQESLEDLKSEYDQYHESFSELVHFTANIKISAIRVKIIISGLSN